MRNRLINLLGLLLLPALLWAANTTINRVPSTTGSGAATYQTDLDLFLRQEDAARQGELPLFPQGVMARQGGGLHGTAASMTSPPFTTTAYTSAGNRLAHPSASINYATQACTTNGTAWVIASGQTAVTLGTFVRVPGTPYYTDCVSGPTNRPPLPADSLALMKVTLASAQITTVQDLAVRTLDVAGTSTGQGCLAGSAVTMPATGDIVIDATVGGKPILSANSQRCSAMIYNAGGAPMRCGPSTVVVSATVGFPIQAGATLSLGAEGTELWKCIRTTATNTAASIAEAIAP